MSDLPRLLGYRPTFPADPIGGAVKRFAGSKIDEFLANAKQFLGQPYLWGGGHSSKTGVQRVDCSGLVLQAARLSGLNLDGTAATQQRMGEPIAMSDLKPGDLLFKGNPATHVGIYLGGGKFIHSPRTGDVVKIVDLKSYTSFDNARRVFSEAPAAPSAKPPSPAAQAPQVPQPAPPARPAGPGPHYVTQPGETLWRIAERTLGDRNRWRELQALNPGLLYNPNLVYPGMTLALPTDAQLPAPATAAPLTAQLPADELRRQLVALRDRVRGTLTDLGRLSSVLAAMKPQA